MAKNPLYEPREFKPIGLMTMNCMHNHYAGKCTSRLCECTCHRDPEEGKKRLRAAREAAHQAVKAFDLAPNIQNTTAAIEALSEYEQHLKEENDGPVVQPGL